MSLGVEIKEGYEEVDEELEKIRTIEALKRLDKAVDKEGNIVDEEAYWEIPKLIRNRLNLVSREEIGEVIEKLEERIEKLEELFKKHHHKEDKILVEL